MDGSRQAAGRVLDEFQWRMADKLKHELGPQICGFLGQPNIIAIMLNPDGTLWVDRLGGDMGKRGRTAAVLAV
jgi:type IV secretion system protein TrbB